MDDFHECLDSLDLFMLDVTHSFHSTCHLTHGSGLTNVVFVQITTRGISACHLTHGSGLTNVVFVRITTRGISAFHLTRGSRLTDVVLYGQSLGYVLLPPDLWVKINRCCACTDNHLGMSACHLTCGSGLTDVVLVRTITWVCLVAT